MHTQDHYSVTGHNIFNICFNSELTSKRLVGLPYPAKCRLKVLVFVSGIVPGTFERTSPRWNVFSYPKFGIQSGQKLK